MKDCAKKLYTVAQNHTGIKKFFEQMRKKTRMTKKLKKMIVLTLVFAMFASNTLSFFNVSDVKTFANEIVESEESIESSESKETEPEVLVEENNEESKENSSNKEIDNSDNEEIIEEKVTKASDSDVEEISEDSADEEDGYEDIPEEVNEEEVVDTENEEENEAFGPMTKEQVEEYKNNQKEYGADPYVIDPDRDKKFDETGEEIIEEASPSEVEEEIVAEDTTEEEDEEASPSEADEETAAEDTEENAEEASPSEADEETAADDIEDVVEASPSELEDLLASLMNANMEVKAEEASVSEIKANNDQLFGGVWDWAKDIKFKIEATGFEKNGVVYTNKSSSDFRFGEWGANRFIVGTGVPIPPSDGNGHFAGWFLKDGTSLIRFTDGNGMVLQKNVVNNIHKMSNENNTLYGYYYHKVDLVDNGADEVKQSVLYVLDGRVYASIDNFPGGAIYSHLADLVPEKKGYKFIGYFDNNDQTNNDTSNLWINDAGTVMHSFFQSMTSDKTLYAHWERNSKIINLDMNAGTDRVENVSNVTKLYVCKEGSHSIYYDIKLTDGPYTMNDVVSNLEFKRTGYETHVRWNQKSDSSGYIIDDNFKAYSLIDNGTIYAMWTPIVYTIELDDNGGHDGLDYIYEKYGAGFGIIKDNVPSQASGEKYKITTFPRRDSYVFNGYWTEASGGSQVIDKDGNVLISNKKITNNSTKYYAQWKEKEFEITLLKNGADSQGTKAVYERYGKGIYKTSGGSTLVDKINVPGWLGHTFKGYFNSATGDIQYIKADGTINTDNFTDTTFTSATILVAQWDTDVYQIILSDNKETDATGVPGLTEFFEVYGKGFNEDKSTNVLITNILSKLPTRDGYIFDGYYTKAKDGDQVIDKNGIIMIGNTVVTSDGSAKYFAHWIKVGIKKVLVDKKQGNVKYDGRDLTELYTWNGNLYLDADAGVKYLASNLATEKKNYKFDGLYYDGHFNGANRYGIYCLDSDGNPKPDIYDLLDSSLIYAKWSPNVYQINLDDNKETDNTGDAGLTKFYEVYEKGFNEDESTNTVFPIKLSKLPTRDNYDFLGYYTESENGEQVIDKDGNILIANNKVTSSDTTKYFAHWKKPIKTINIKKNGGNVIYNGSDLSKLYIWKGALYVDSNVENGYDKNNIIIEKDGNVFGGFFDSTYTTQYLTVDGSLITDIYSLDDGSSIYAKWTPNVYLINLADNKGTDTTGDVGLTKFYEVYGEGFNETGDTAIGSGTLSMLPTRNASLFNGYWTTADGGDQVIDKNGRILIDNKKVTSDGTVTYYAHWTDKDIKEIIIDNKGGSVKYADKEINKLYVWGIGLYVDADATILYEPEKLKAEKERCAYNGIYGNFSGSIKDYDTGIVANHGKSKLITTEGELIGWLYGSDTTTYKDIHNIQNFDNNIIFPVWIPDVYQINLDDNKKTDTTGDLGLDKFYEVYGEGFNETGDTTVGSGKLSKLPTRDNYDFLGYYTESENGEPVIDKDGNILIDNKKVTTNADTKYYAHWEKADIRKIYVEDREGDVKYKGSNLTELYTWAGVLYTDADASVEYTASELITEKKGHAFDGFYDITDVTQYIKNDGSETASIYGLADESTIYAKWTTNVYNVVFDYNYDSKGEYTTLPKTYGVDLPMPTNPTRPGRFDFDGWYENPEGTGDKYVGIKELTDGTDTKTVYAKWSVIEINVLKINAYDKGNLTTYYYKDGQLYTNGGLTNPVDAIANTASEEEKFIGYFNAKSLDGLISRYSFTGDDGKVVKANAEFFMKNNGVDEINTTAKYNPTKLHIVYHKGDGTFRGAMNSLDTIDESWNIIEESTIALMDSAGFEYNNEKHLDGWQIRYVDNSLSGDTKQTLSYTELSWNSDMCIKEVDGKYYIDLFPVFNSYSSDNTRLVKAHAKLNIGFLHEEGGTKVNTGLVGTVPVNVFETKDKTKPYKYLTIDDSTENYTPSKISDILGYELNINNQYTLKLEKLNQSSLDWYDNVVATDAHTAEKDEVLYTFASDSPVYELVNQFTGENDIHTIYVDDIATSNRKDNTYEEGRPVFKKVRYLSDATAVTQEIYKEYVLYGNLINKTNIDAICEASKIEYDYYAEKDSEGDYVEFDFTTSIVKDIDLYPRPGAAIIEFVTNGGTWVSEVIPSQSFIGDKVELPGRNDIYLYNNYFDGWSLSNTEEILVDNISIDNKRLWETYLYKEGTSNRKLTLYAWFTPYDIYEDGNSELLNENVKAKFVAVDADGNVCTDGTVLVDVYKTKGTDAYYYIRMNNATNNAKVSDILTATLTNDAGSSWKLSDIKSDKLTYYIVINGTEYNAAESIELISILPDVKGLVENIASEKEVYVPLSTHKVNIHKNDETGSTRATIATESVVVAIGLPMSGLPDETEVHRDGYNFLELNTSQNGIGDIYRKSDLGIGTLNDLYIRWQPKTYNVKFASYRGSLDGGETEFTVFDGDEQTPFAVTFDDVLTGLSTPSDIEAPFEFLGWKLAGTGDDIKEVKNGETWTYYNDVDGTFILEPIIERGTVYHFLADPSNPDSGVSVPRTKRNPLKKADDPEIPKIKEDDNGLSLDVPPEVKEKSEAYNEKANKVKDNQNDTQNTKQLKLEFICTPSSIVTVTRNGNGTTYSSSDIIWDNKNKKFDVSILPVPLGREFAGFADSEQAINGEYTYWTNEKGELDVSVVSDYLNVMNINEDTVQLYPIYNSIPVDDLIIEIDTEPQFEIFKNAPKSQKHDIIEYKYVFGSGLQGINGNSVDYVDKKDYANIGLSFEGYKLATIDDNSEDVNIFNASGQLMLSEEELLALPKTNGKIKLIADYTSETHADLYFAAKEAGHRYVRILKYQNEYHYFDMETLKTITNMGKPSLSYADYEGYYINDIQDKTYIVDVEGRFTLDSSALFDTLVNLTENNENKYCSCCMEIAKYKTININISQSVLEYKKYDGIDQFIPVNVASISEVIEDNNIDLINENGEHLDGFARYNDIFITLDGTLTDEFLEFVKDEANDQSVKIDIELAAHYKEIEPTEITIHKYYDAKENGDIKIYRRGNNLYSTNKKDSKTIGTIDFILNDSELTFEGCYADIATDSDCVIDKNCVYNLTEQDNPTQLYAIYSRTKEVLYPVYAQYEYKTSNGTNSKNTFLFQIKATSVDNSEPIYTLCGTSSSAQISNDEIKNNIEKHAIDCYGSGSTVVVYLDNSQGNIKYLYNSTRELKLDGTVIEKLIQKAKKSESTTIYLVSEKVFGFAAEN